MNWSDVFNYEDGYLFWKVYTGNRSVKIGDKIAQTTRNGYHKVGYKYKTYSVHRIVWELHRGSIPKDMWIDHINGDGTDNRIDNLRLVTPSTNARNRSIHRTKQVVGLVKIGNKWRASLNLGTYSTKNEAVEIVKLVSNLLKEKSCVQL